MTLMINHNPPNKVARKTNKNQTKQKTTHYNCKFGLGPGPAPCTRAADRTPTHSTPQQLRGSTHLAERCLHALFGHGNEAPKTNTCPQTGKQDQVRNPPGAGGGELWGSSAGCMAHCPTPWMDRHTGLLALSRKNKFCIFMNKIAQTKVVSTAHPQLKYPAQQLFNSHFV